MFKITSYTVHDVRRFDQIAMLKEEQFWNLKILLSFEIGQYFNLTLSTKKSKIKSKQADRSKD